MIAFTEVSIGEGGTLHCGSCGPATPPVPSDLAGITESFESAATHLEGARNVTFAGFEPFAHPALPDIIATAVDAGFVRIRLRTDAGALCMPGNAEGAFSAGVRHIELVLLGDAETHDHLSRKPGLFAAAQAGLAAFRAVADAGAEQVFVSGAFPLCKHNLNVAPQAVAAFAQLGCEAVRLEAARLAHDGTASAILDAALDSATINGVHAWVAGLDGMRVPYDRAPWSEVASHR